MDDYQPTRLSNQNIMTKMVRGGAWVYGRLLVTSVINLGVMAILARKLSPAEFGLVALAQVILGFLAVLGAEGVSGFVIYDNEEGREERIQAAFWMDLAFSISSILLGLLLVPLITRFYTQPGLGSILVVMLLSYPIKAISNVPDALIKKRLDFHKLAIRDTVLDILSSFTSVALALTGWGVWSLVIPGVLAFPLRAIIVFRMARWHPHFALHVRLWPRIFSYSANVIGGTLTSLIIAEGDTLLVGKLIGSQALGIYNIAWVTANLVCSNVSGIINKMAMPAFSAVSDDLDRVRVGLNRLMRVISIITFPLLIGLFVVADRFILTVYGPQWGGAVLPLRIFIIYALRYSVATPAGEVYKSIGRPDIAFKLGLVIVPFYLISIWIGSFYGIVGVAAGVTIVRTVFGLINFQLVGRCLKEKFIKVIEPVIPAFMASCWMGGVVLLAKLLLERLLLDNNLFILVTLVAVGGLTYLVLLRNVYHSLAQDLLQVTAPLLGSFQGLVKKILNSY